MGINKLHDIGAIVVGGSGGFNLDGVRDLSPDPGLAMLIENAGGQVDPSFCATIASQPSIAGTVTDLATALASIGISGLAFPNSTVITTVDAYFTQMAKGGTRAGASSHFRVRCNEGIVIPKSITWSQRQAATLTLEIHVSFDGSNEPFVYTDSVSLPHVPSIGEMFTGGPCEINGVLVPGVIGATIDFGLELEKADSDGELYPTFITIVSRRPKIDLRTKEILTANTFGLTGTAQGSTDSLIYLQKVGKNAKVLAAETAEHICFTVDDGMIYCGAFGGSNNATGEGVVTIQPTFDATNAIIAINTATAITLAA